MDTRRLKGIILTTVSCTVVAVVCAAPFIVDPGPNQTDVSTLFEAYHLFVQERTEQDLPLPASVSIDTLVKYGFLEEKEVIDFTKVDLWLAITNSRLPQDWVMRARFADQSEVILLNDGSVQQFSRERAQLLAGSPLE